MVMVGLRSSRRLVGKILPTYSIVNSCENDFMVPGYDQTKKLTTRWYPIEEIIAPIWYTAVGSQVVGRNRHICYELQQDTIEAYDFSQVSGQFFLLHLMGTKVNKDKNLVETWKKGPGNIRMYNFCQKSLKPDPKRLSTITCRNSDDTRMSISINAFEGITRDLLFEILGWFCFIFSSV